MLGELEQLAAVLDVEPDEAHALILYSSLKSGFSAGADLRELYAGAKNLGVA